MNKSDIIFIAGHNGMVGSAFVRKLKSLGFNNIITASHSDLNLTDQNDVKHFFETHNPDIVFLAAAKVGGIHANNTYRGEFIYSNLMIQNNVIHQAHESKVKKLLFMGSSCIYPRNCSQPIKEEYMLTGVLEHTNEPYAIAKIAGIKMCDAYRDQYGCNFISVMPTNLYGPNDTYDLKNSHVLPALLRKFHTAKVEGNSEVEVWGTGTPRREFLHVDDLADACMFLMENYNEAGLVNIGVGEDISIKELALLIKDIVGYQGVLTFNTDKPDGTPQKLLDVSKLKALGWEYNISLKDGINSVYKEIADTPVFS